MCACVFHLRSLKMPMPPGQHARDMWFHVARRLLGRRPRVRRGGRRRGRRRHSNVPDSTRVPPPKWVLPYDDSQQWSSHPRAVSPCAYSRGTMARMKLQACREEGGPSFFRPCVDCGRITGSFCDFCNGAERLPQERWNENQGTPLCGDCDDKRGCCHFCEGKSWCRPPGWPLTDANYRP